jgi:prevent-host-death family protein
MAKTYSVADARAHLPDILDEAMRGRDVHLTRRGHPVAVVVSAERYDALRGARRSFGEAYREFLARHEPKDMGFDAAFFDALRDRRPSRPVRL